MMPGTMPPSPVSDADLQIYQGDDYFASVVVLNADGEPMDLTGYMAQAQIRKRVADKDPVVVVEIQCGISSNVPAGVTIPAYVSLFIPHTETQPLSGHYLWDLQIVDGSGKITTILAGNVYAYQEVTRELAAPGRLAGVPALT